MIKSAPKQSKIIIAIVVFVALVSAALTGLLVSNKEPVGPKLVLGGTTFSVEIAKTEAERIKGLSGRDALPENHMMLFNSEKSEVQCFWMKDMKFSIDMVWLDDNQNVSKILPDVSPDTYPKTFCSDVRGHYVLELPAGTASKQHISVGQSVSADSVNP